MASFVTLDYAKMLLGITTSTGDAQLQALLDTACQTASDFCGRRFLSQSYTEFYDGNNTPTLCLRQYPVTAIASLYVDANSYFGDAANAFGAGTLLTLGQDYSIQWDGNLGTDNEGSTNSTPASLGGFVRRVGGVWPGRLAYVPGQLCYQLTPGLGNIKVTYTAGWTVETMPMTLRWAVVMLAQTLKRAVPFGGPLGSESWQGYSYSLLRGQTSPREYPEFGTIRQALIKFRKVV